MSSVRQAHMPGNYEMYDQAANKLGPVVCKLCWERSREKNPASLTVWVSYKEGLIVWWLCPDCAEDVRASGHESTTFIKSAEGVIHSPGLVQG